MGVAVDHERRVARPSTAQIGYALDRAQQAAQQSGVQYNLFVGSAQARSVAAAAPPIVVPQPKVPAHLLRGRAEILRKSDRLLGPAPPDEDTRQRVTVFYGMGGVGKTTLALEIARRALAKRIAVWWIPADQADTMRAAFYSLRSIWARGRTTSITCIPPTFSGGGLTRSGIPGCLSSTTLTTRPY